MAIDSPGQNGLQREKSLANFPQVLTFSLSNALEQIMLCSSVKNSVDFFLSASYSVELFCNCTANVLLNHFHEEKK